MGPGLLYVEWMLTPGALGQPWSTPAKQVVTGVVYKGADGVERVAKGHLTLVCDGMYSNLRKVLSEAEVSWPAVHQH